MTEKVYRTHRRSASAARDATTAELRELAERLTAALEAELDALEVAIKRVGALR
jgi:hypothetical protein